MSAAADAARRKEVLMGSLTKRGLAAIGLAAVVLMAPVQAAMAGSGIVTTRPMSDARFDADPKVTTTRPLSDAAFGIRAGSNAERANVSRRVLSDATFEPQVVAGTRPATDAAPETNPSTATPLRTWMLIGLAAAVAVICIAMIERRRRPMRPA
jgi:hypothetical protein